jgi:hypothetical protein
LSDLLDECVDQLGLQLLLLLCGNQLFLQVVVPVAKAAGNMRPQHLGTYTLATYYRLHITGITTYHRYNSRKGHPQGATERLQRASETAHGV